MKGSHCVGIYSISKQCVCCLPNTSESIKHKFWDYIQTRRAWRWATLSCMNSVGLELAIMIVLTENKLFLGKGFVRSTVKISKHFHLLRGITLWTIWIECNNKVFNYEHWHESKVTHRIWDELIVYAKATWDRVIKQIKISSSSTVAMLRGFDKTWGAKNVLCRRNNLHIE